MKPLSLQDNCYLTISYSLWQLKKGRQEIIEMAKANLSKTEYNTEWTSYLFFWRTIFDAIALCDMPTRFENQLLLLLDQIMDNFMYIRSSRKFQIYRSRKLQIPLEELHHFPIDFDKEVLILLTNYQYFYSFFKDCISN